MQNLFDLSVSRTHANVLIIINANGTRINRRSTCDRSVSKLERRGSIYRSDRCESLRCARCGAGRVLAPSVAAAWYGRGQYSHGGFAHLRRFLFGYALHLRVDR